VTERFFEPSRGVLGDILVERARQGARGEDALDGGVVARAERRGVAERAIDLVGGIALAQEQNLARLRAPDARRPEAHQAEELRGVLAHIVERDVELVEVDGTAPLRRGMESGRVELEAGAARAELVARDAPQVGGVHEQLALRDPHGQDVSDVVVGNGVVIAGPGDEAVDAADAVDHARGVVRTPRQRDQVVALLGETVERGALVEPAVVDDVLEPVRELRTHIVEVAKLATVEERPLDLPK
jgi:hypothetical protein